MVWCPVCLEEYREGFTVCADCGSKLVEECSKEMLISIEERKAQNKMTPQKLLKRFRIHILPFAVILAIYVVATRWSSFNSHQGIKDLPVLDSSTSESSVSEATESSISGAAFQYMDAACYYQEPAPIMNAVRPDDDELLDAAFWTQQANFSPIRLIPNFNYFIRDGLLDIESIPQSGTREGDLFYNRRWGIDDFVHKHLDFRDTYIFAEVKSLPYPFRYYFMPEEEYTHWGMRLFGGAANEWQSFINSVHNIVIDKSTLIKATGFSEAQAAHWPDGKYIGIEEYAKFEAHYRAYSRHINRVENIRLRDDLGVTVTLHYSPEHASYITTEYIDVSFFWDEEIGFIIESFERRENERVHVFVKGDYEILDGESDIPSDQDTALLDEAGAPFALEEGEFSQNKYATSNRIFLITNRRCCAFEASTGKLINVKSLPAFLVSEDEEDRTYMSFVVNDDLTELSYTHQYEYPEYYSIYLCSLDGDQEPRMLLTLDPEKSEVQQEYYHVVEFLENDRLLMVVGGWEWTYRYEVMDKNGNTLLAVPPKEEGSFAGYGGGFTAYHDGAIILSSMSKNFEDERGKIPPQYYFADFNQLTLTRMDWIYSQVPLTDTISVHGEHDSGRIGLVVSEDLTRGVFSISYAGEPEAPYDRTEFYYVDFMEETATLLPQVIENRIGYPMAIVGDYFYFTYSAVREVDNQKSMGGSTPPTYIARLPK